MTLDQRLNALAQAIGVDVKAVRTMIGVLANLTTTSKTNIVSAINELKSRADSYQSGFESLINDEATQGNVTQVYSADRVLDLLVALEAKIFGGMPPGMLDTLKELADYLTDNTVAGGLVQQLAVRVRVDGAQSFNAAEQSQGRDNIGAASAVALQELVNSLGNVDLDLVAVYTAARGAV